MICSQTRWERWLLLAKCLACSSPSVLWSGDRAWFGLPRTRRPWLLQLIYSIVCCFQQGKLGFCCGLRWYKPLVFKAGRLTESIVLITGLLSWELV